MAFSILALIEAPPSQAGVDTNPGEPPVIELSVEMRESTATRNY